jgi:protein required for attachment to host cells
MTHATWILVADASRARLFEHHRAQRTFELVHEDDRPELRDREAMRDSDRPGRVHERSGQVRHGMEPPTPGSERVREDFARELVGRLHEGVTEQRFDQLVLVAPPTMLGTLRGLLDDALRERVSAELGKDLTKLPVHELIEHLGEWVSVDPPPRGPLRR